MVLVAPSANASSALWCIGFNDCADKGYSDSQYSRYWGNMYWLMYSGRNCVNYVAFREVQAGMPNVRPWHGSGNAEAWGRDNPSITDHTPRVGSVAWWRAGAQGAGGFGHVAYVERVLSPTEIVVSESNWGSDFDWRYINTSRNWPTGFIHWTDQPLTPSVKPTVPGTPVVGQVLALHQGSWPRGTRLSFQWGVARVPIPGATGTRFVPSPDQLGKKLTVRVTARRPGFRPTALVVGTRLGVAPGVLTGDAAPIVSGIAQVGHTLTVTRPEIVPAPDQVAVQWYANGVAIPGAADWTFTPTQDQNGAAITATVTATRAAYTTLTMTSPSTVPVLSPPIVLTRRGGVSGKALVGQTLLADPGNANPGDAVASYTWTRDGTPISGATSSAYVIVPEDIAHRLGVRVLLRKQQYLDARSVYVDPAPVLTQSSIRTVVRVGERMLRLRIAVSAVGTVPTGGVVIDVNGSHLTAPLVRGVARIDATGLPAGAAHYAIRYTSDGRATSSQATGAAQVLPASRVRTVISHIGMITGTMAAGGRLSAPRVPYAPWDSSIRYQWMRDGVAIPRANGATYLLTHADSGHMVTVVETAVHPGLAPSSSVFAPVGSVIADPTFAVRTVGGVLRAKATVAVKEMGKPATGTVTFASGGVTTTRPLVNGVATAALSGLAPGTRTISVSYSGDARTAAGTTSAQVPVLARPPAGTAAIDPHVAVVGRPTIGSVLSIQVPAYAPWSGRLYYQWLRDGRPIAGAKTSAYRVQSLDAGHRLSVKATVTAARLAPAAAVYAVRGVITTPAVMGVIATPGANAVTVKVQVSAADLPASGSVHLVLRGTTRRVTAALRNGVATLTMTRVPAGHQAFYVIYSGSPAAPAMHQTIVVDVTGRR